MFQEPGWIPLLEALVKIQRLTSVPVRIPDGPISYGDANAAFSLAKALECGKESGTVNGFTLTIERSGVESLVTTLTAQRPIDATIALPADELQLLGNTIPLGAVVREIRNCRPAPDELERLKRALDDQAEVLTIAFRSTADCTVYYVDRLPEPDQSSMRSRYNLPDGKIDEG